MKKFCSIVILLTMVLTVVVPMNVQAASQPISVYIDNKAVKFDASPVIENGRTLVPMRAIFEGLNTNVEWDETTRTVTAMTEYLMCLELQIGNSTATKYFLDYSDYDFENQTGVIGKDSIQKISLDVPAKIINGRTMVPLKFIAESMGYEVKWNATAKRVDILTGADVKINPSADSSGNNQLSEETLYKQSCVANRFDVRDATVNPSRNVGKLVSFDGNIIKIENNIILIHSFIDGYVSAKMPSGIGQYYIDDGCVIYGELNGTRTYTMKDEYGFLTEITVPFVEAKYADGQWNENTFNSQKDQMSSELAGMYGTWKHEYGSDPTSDYDYDIEVTPSTFDGERYVISFSEKRRDTASGEYIYMVLKLPDYAEHFIDSDNYTYYKEDGFQRTVQYYYLKNELKVYRPWVWFSTNNYEIYTK